MWRKLGILALAIFAFLPYQNCSETKDFSSGGTKASENAASSGNGGFYDGKILVTFGQCGDELTAVRARIKVAYDRTRAEKLRENCSDIAPVAIPLAQLQFPVSTLDIVIYSGLTFVGEPNGSLSLPTLTGKAVTYPNTARGNSLAGLLFRSGTTLSLLELTQGVFRPTMNFHVSGASFFSAGGISPADSLVAAGDFLGTGVDQVLLRGNSTFKLVSHSGGAVTSVATINDPTGTLGASITFAQPGRFGGPRLQLVVGNGAGFFALDLAGSASNVSVQSRTAFSFFRTDGSSGPVMDYASPSLIGSFTGSSPSMSDILYAAGAGMRVPGTLARTDSYQIQGGEIVPVNHVAIYKLNQQSGSAYIDMSEFSQVVSVGAFEARSMRDAILFEKNGALLSLHVPAGVSGSLFEVKTLAFIAP